MFSPSTSLFSSVSISVSLCLPSPLSRSLCVCFRSVERLSADFCSPLGAAHSSGFFGQPFVEAPAMFRRGAVYYALFGLCCCYCQVLYCSGTHRPGPRHADALAIDR